MMFNDRSDDVSKQMSRNAKLAIRGKHAYGLNVQLKLFRWP